MTIKRTNPQIGAAPPPIRAFFDARPGASIFRSRSRHCRLFRPDGQLPKLGRLARACARAQQCVAVPCAWTRSENANPHLVPAGRRQASVDHLRPVGIAEALEREQPGSAALPWANSLRLMISHARGMTLALRRSGRSPTICWMLLRWAGAYPSSIRIARPFDQHP
jgi:hypothetical protein